MILSQHVICNVVITTLQHYNITNLAQGGEKWKTLKWIC